MGKQWTASEDKFLIKMRKAGESYREIGIRLERSAGACQQRGFGLGISKKQSSEPLPIDLPAYTDTNTEVTEDFVWDVQPRPTLFRRLMRTLIGD